MMSLDGQKDCDKCLDLSPEIEKPQKIVKSDGTIFQTDTIVTCEHATRCDMIKRYLIRKMTKGDRL